MRTIWMTRIGMTFAATVGAGLVAVPAKAAADGIAGTLVQYKAADRSIETAAIA